MQAQNASDLRFHQGVDAIYRYSDLPADLNSYENLITETFTNNIIYYSNCLDLEQLKVTITELQKNFLKQEKHDFTGLADLGIYIINTVMNTTQFPEQEILRERFLFDFHFCISYDDFFGLLINYISTIIEQKKEKEHITLSAPVQSARNYINEHYFEKIYLDDIAKWVCLSSTYLSAIFKKELGTGITEYINLVRCSKAKELLKTTVLSIGSIAEKTGYADEKYFQHSFKKIVGITPAQFRRIHS